MKRGAVPLLALTLMVAGCSSSGSDSDSSEPDPADESSSAAVVPERAAEAKQDLSAAVRSMTREPHTDFVASVLSSNSEDPVQTATGSLLGSGSWRVTVNTPDQAQHSNTLYALAADHVVYMRMADWPEKQDLCWLQMSREQVPGGIVALLPDEPAYVSALAGLSARGYVPDVGNAVVGDLEMGYALELLPGRILQNSGVVREDYFTDDLVPTRITFKAGRVSGYQVPGDALRDTMEQAGIDVDAVSGLFLDDATFEVSFPKPGTSPRPVVAPPASQVVTPEMTAAGDEGCSA